LRIEDLTPPITSNQFFDQSGEKVHLFQTEAHARMGMNFVKGFDGYLGYEIRNFDSNSADGSVSGVFASQIHQVKGFGLSGFTLGLSYHF
jgi:hypothetical protein